jgi:hypothetical protein
MLFSDKGIELELSQVSGEGKMVLVKHPGYFRNKGMKKFFIYLFHLSLFFRDSKSLLFESGIGTWEKNEQSLAFVPKNSRKQYVCGGSWGGKRKIFLDFSTDLENRIDQDLTIKIVARFHDESHINWYLANHSCIVLDPSYCFEESYSHLVSVKKRIVAVNKSSSLVWER